MTEPVGIDLGTTYSLIARMTDTGVRVIPADTGQRSTPSVVLIDGAQTIHHGECDRLFDLFDGKDEAAVAAARARWAAAKTAGHTLTYWQQGARGWEKKA